MLYIYIFLDLIKELLKKVQYLQTRVDQMCSDTCKIPHMCTDIGKIKAVLVKNSIDAEEGCNLFEPKCHDSIESVEAFADKLEEDKNARDIFVIMVEK